MTRTGAAATALFVVTAWLTTQIESLRAVLPFTEDPFDAVVSFALVGIGVIGGLTLVRAAGQRRRPFDRAVARRIAIGATLAAITAALALGSDLVAVLLVGVDLAAPGVGPALALLGIAIAAAAVAIAGAWRARRVLVGGAVTEETEPDILDAVESIVGAVGATGMADRFDRWVERSALSPRRHRVVVGLLGAVGAGAAAVIWHALREGPWTSPTAAATFAGLMAAGVAGVYLLALTPLRILRRPGRS